MVQPITAERFDVVSLMSADEARACVNAINGHMNSARALLLDLYERRGWQQLGYTSWMECVTEEFEYNKASLWRQLQAAQIEQRLELPIGNQSEWRLRPLGALDPADQPAAWKEANERTNGKPTARTVAQVVADRLEQKAEFMPAVAPRFNDGLKSTESVEWYTPETIYTRVRAVFGGAIDTDPCTSIAAQSRIGARRFYTAQDNGIDQPWEGNAFVNPPYGDEIKPWPPRAIEAYTTGECRSVILLVPGRTDTDWFTPLLTYPICIVHGRLTFWNPDKPDRPAPFPSIVVYLGPDLPAFRAAFADIGPIYVPIGA